ncbi:uncharacterized protein I303_101736 [Kwoniella dejecticola CBS 10117]|uniref:Extracellular membrane protein CFEM domain-containing protein n=1 Tax=Kwoniella dejecticola CBS 10117 TaxID=1296121 RepID=A0A1A6ACZ0_9TREE|nr:uncharacterized protein I303_02128 [Kwoniella dejecticola CBS 10117]OBR87913.1 hypothetical protein I303_02128 [Kwoniella dejecticola CBS 10117]
MISLCPLVVLIAGSVALVEAQRPPRTTFITQPNQRRSTPDSSNPESHSGINAFEQGSSLAAATSDSHTGLLTSSYSYVDTSEASPSYLPSPTDGGVSTITNTLPPTTKPTPTDNVLVDTSKSSDEDGQNDCLDTSIIPLASSLSNLAGQASDNCTATGGGCVVFVESLGSCQDDRCACDLSFSAQVCAQCLATQDAVYSYNLYLAACYNRGLVQPTQTIDVECTDATSTSDVLTDMLASQPASATASAFPGSPGSSVSGHGDSQAAQGGSMGQVAVEVGSDGQTVTKAYGQTSQTAMGAANSIENVITVATTDSNGQPTSVITYIDPTSVPPLSGPAPSAEVTGGVQQPPVDAGSSTAALDSAHTFFQSTIDPKSQNDCDGWQELAETCTSDNCICVPDARSSAAACSSCVLSQSNEQMSAYAGYTQGCIIASTGDTRSGMTETYGNAAVGISPTSTTAQDESNPFKAEIGDDSKGVTRVVEAEHAGGVATRIVIDDDEASAGFSIHSHVGLSGIGWIVTGIIGGLLLMQMG